jgi:hypothetical protein
MNELILITSLIALFVIVFFLYWYFNHNAKTKERLLLIEKGITLESVSQNIKKKDEFTLLRIGIVITGIALGSLAIALLSLIPAIQSFNRFTEDAFPLIVILLFAGLSMILANYMGRPKI